MIPKLAEIITEAQPHQLRAEERGVLGNLILAHGTGSGKTRTAIAIADRLGLPTTVLTPASLVENFKKEIAKHKRGGPRINVLSLPTAVSQNYQVPRGNTLIVDEAHSLRNADTKRQEYVKAQAARAGRKLLLTGTPAYNNVVDWAPLINIVAEKQVLPEDPAAFRNRYIAERRIDPGFWAKWVYGAKPGIVEELKNEKELKARMKPYIDIYYKDAEKPERRDETIDVPMSDEQETLYNYVEGSLPAALKYKLQHDIPPSKSEAKSLNSFLVGVRQASNTTNAYDTDVKPEALERNSTKLKVAADKLAEMAKKTPNFRALVYSNFLDSGVSPYMQLLKRRGINSMAFNGSMSQKEKKAVVDAFNSGKVPVIVGSGSASEGLDLKGTRLIQVLEPHFNNARLEQVIGRGIRYKSHADLPPDQRNVLVQQYRSVHPDNRSWFDKLVGNNTPTAVDTYLASRAAEKQRLMDKLKDLLEH